MANKKGIFQLKWYLYSILLLIILFAWLLIRFSVVSPSAQTNKKDLSKNAVNCPKMLADREISSSCIEAQKTRDVMANIILPKVALENVDLSKALIFLLDESVKYDTRPDGGLSTLHIPSANLPVTSKIIIQEDNISYYDLLNKMCEQVDMYWKIVEVESQDNETTETEIRLSRDKNIL